MTPDTERILERIRRLLALAQGKGATTAEAESAAATARKLLDEHGLTLEQLQALGNDPLLVDFHEIEHGFKRVPPWVKTLCMGLAAGFDCRLCGSARRGVAEELVFLGLAQDAAVAKYLFAVLLSEIPRAARAAADAYIRVILGVVITLQGKERRDFVGSFCLAAAARIGVRLKQARSGQQEEGLVLYKKHLIDSQHPVGKPRFFQASLHSSGGVRAGLAYGNQGNLNTQVLPTSLKRIGGNS